MTLVTGDPASMRAAAAQLRLRAETLCGVSSTVDAQVAGTTYVGEAADRFRAAVATQSETLRALCERMGNTADTLVRQAALVEEQLLAQAQQGEY